TWTGIGTGIGIGDPRPGRGARSGSDVPWDRESRPGITGAGTGSGGDLGGPGKSAHLPPHPPPPPPPLPRARLPLPPLGTEPSGGGGCDTAGTSRHWRQSRDIAALTAFPGHPWD
ncbi:LIX1-like protein, partial [Melozone crissalis]|uniref:LIX1-like protein n=1 Tax=Melozone crissalis TaxID=40204 RepID=UPI0023D9B3D6